MKRFLGFVLFVLLLVFAVRALQIWHNQQPEAFSGWPAALTALFGESGRPKYTLADGPRISAGEVNILTAMSQERIKLARTVVPSVVSILTSRRVVSPEPSNDPFYRFFRQGRSRGGGAQTQTERTLGSGVIVTKEGHIVTNNHVIDQMDEIQVVLSNGHTKQATVIGTSAEADVAVLKINAGEPITPLPFGDSDKVEVGETILAVGNPYGFAESVTQGIISAKDRAGSETQGDLFQIDAAINPGNSGGPLINVRGELIGINEAIYSESGGSQGVGFAIPSSTIRRTLDSILKNGRVISGYLGVRALPNSPADGKGALIDGVVEGSAADKAGIQPGDLIEKFNHKDVRDFAELRRWMAQVDVDASVPIDLVRDGKPLTVTVQLSAKPPAEAQLAQVFRRQQSPGNAGPRQRGGMGGSPGGGSGLMAGVMVADLTPAMLHLLQLPDDEEGVLVARVDANSPAAGALQVGDVVEQVGEEAVASVADFQKFTRNRPVGAPVVLVIVRGHTRSTVEIRNQ